VLNWLSKELLLAISISLAVALFVVSWVGPPRRDQEPPGKQRDAYSQTNQADSDGGLSFQIECDPNCTGKDAKKDENQGRLSRLFDKTINDPIAILTGLLGLATIFLVIGVRFQIRDARDSSERRLRAYVSVMPSAIKRMTSNEVFHFSFTLMNAGVTPAYLVQHDGVLCVVEHPLPDGFPFPKVSPGRQSKLMVPPRTPIAGHLLAAQKFTKAEIIEIFEGKAQEGRRLYVFGHIDYIDIFRQKRWTRFCFSFPGWHEAVSRAQNDQWDDIITALRNIGPQLQFEVASQHNITESG
jgi:hypothetical protein